jgi:carboxypeptidase Taq
MDKKLAALRLALAEVADIDASLAVLEWDQQTQMPPGGADGRGHAMGALARLSHLRFTSAEIGKLLDSLGAASGSLDPDSDEARLLRVTARRYRKLVRVPADLVAELAQAAVAGQQAWERAREQNDFPLFLPHLEKLFGLRRRYAELFAPYDHVYDPLLDDFEPGLKTADVRAVFEALRREQVTLIREIAARPQVDDSFLRRHYDEAAQWEFTRLVASSLGYDWTRGRIDRAAHPFTTAFGTGDVRITTRVLASQPAACLFATMHETGHALYELGIDEHLGRSPLATGASNAFHESQSRLWENLVGRSLPFWEHTYPALRKTFPSQLGGVSVEAFYRAINRVEPSLIRVEADEATYNLHIMLRFEIEIGLLEGTIQPRDLPAVWSERMREYLGIAPPDDAQGVLQDIHWSTGAVGYFPTYALGNLISAQLWEKVRAEIPDLDDRMRRGELRGLLDWLRHSIHRHGAKFEPQELVRRVTGTGIDPRAYVAYLRRKLGGIYGL